MPFAGEFDSAGNARMLKNRPYRLVPLSRIVLLKLYVEHVNDTALERFTPADVCGLFRVPMSRNLIESALERLSREGSYNSRAVSGHGTKKNGDRGYRIGDEGIFTVEAALKDSSSDLSYFMKVEDEGQALEDIAGLNGIFWTREELLQDADWRPLEVSKEAHEYKDAVDAAEEALRAAEGSNELASKHPEEREGILAALRQGVEWIRNKVPSKAIIRSTLLEPLRWIASTLANSVAGEAAKRAAQRILDWLSSVLF